MHTYGYPLEIDKIYDQFNIEPNYLGIRDIFINDKSKSILDKLKQFKVALFISVLLVLIISIYRIYIVFQYMKQLKDKCECKEYTIEYFIIKYHNFYQILGIVIMMILSIISLIMLFRLKKNMIK